MKDKNREFWLTVIMLIAIAIFFLFVALLNPAAGTESRTVWTKEYKSNFFKDAFEEFFTEPFETLVLVMKKGEVLTFTTRDRDRIDLDPCELDFLLRKRGKTVKDIVFTVHNHLTSQPPTPGNHRAHHLLKRMGFEGPSFVYYPATGELVPVKNP